MAKYTQLTYKDIVQIETYLDEGFKVSDIAIKLGKDHSTIYRCIKNNGELDENGETIFIADKIWQKIIEKRQNPNKPQRILEGSLLEQFVLEKIESYWSPEQISSVWTNKTSESLSHETIYQFIYKYHPKLVKLFFRRKGKKYEHKRREKYQIPDRRMIDGRPKAVEERKRFGDWEGDTIIGKNHKQAIVTNVERKSGLLLAKKVEQKTAKNIADVTKELFKGIPEELRVTMTYDNGREFALHKLIEQENKMTVYFAHPYASWQRGTSENTNGLLRQYIPKGTDFNKVTEEDLQKYVNLINNRPRKRLGFKTPLEVFEEQSKKFAVGNGI